MSKKRISSSPYQKRTTIFDRFLTHMKKPMKLATALITASALLALNSVGAADDDHKAMRMGKKRDARIPMQPSLNMAASSRSSTTSTTSL